MLCKTRSTYCWVSLILSFFVPGLGLLLSGKIRRAIVWFVFLEVILDTLLRFSLLYSIYLLWLTFLCTFILWAIMMVDSWRPIKSSSRKRCAALIVLAISTTVIWTFLDPMQNIVDFGFLAISSGSMKPTLVCHRTALMSDRILWLKTAYRTSSPQRGDIVIVTNCLPLNNSEIYVRRVAGLPGETIRIDPPCLFVNGALVLEPSIFQALTQVSNGYVGFQLPITSSWCSVLLTSPNDEIKNGSNEFFLLGDNSCNCFDSRYYGAVNISNIVGKAKAIIWPPNRIRDF